MTVQPVLQDLVDDAAFLSHEHQLHLVDLHGDDAWSADLTTGTFVFTAVSGATTDCRLQYLGSSAPGPGTWLWGWHNVNGFPDDVLRAAEEARALGLPETTAAELALSEDLPYRLVLAAKAATASMTHYSGPVGGGTRAWFLVEHPSFALPAPSVPRVVRTLSEGLLSVTVADHRRALLAYAHARDLNVEHPADDALRLVLPDGTVTVALDDHGRVAGIQASSGRASAATDAPEEAGATSTPAPEAAPASEAAPDVRTGPSAAPAPAPQSAPEPPRRRWFRRRG